MKIKQDWSSVIIWWALTVLYIGVFMFLFACLFIVKREDFFIVLALLLVVLIGIALQLRYWRFNCSTFEINETGGIRKSFPLKPILVHWNECVECGICVVPDGYMIYASRVPLSTACKLGIPRQERDKKLKHVWERDAFRVALCPENVAVFYRYAPQSLLDMLEADPLFAVYKQERPSSDVRSE